MDHYFILKAYVVRLDFYREVYYRHLAHLFDRLGSLEVAISLIRKINYRPDSVRTTLDSRLILNPSFSSTVLEEGSIDFNS